jgi:hypothetical protein
VAERARRRELGELDLCDDLGAQPASAASAAGTPTNGFCSEEGEQGCQTAQLALAEPGADAADVAEPSVRRDADEE